MMGLQQHRNDIAHIAAFIWLTSVTISLIFLKIQHDRTYESFQKSLDDIMMKRNSDPFEVHDEAFTFDGGLGGMDEYNIMMNSKKEEDNINHKTGRLRHVEKSANFEHAQKIITFFSDELKKSTKEKQKERDLDLTLRRKLRFFDMRDGTNRQKSSLARINPRRHKEFLIKNISKKRVKVEYFYISAGVEEADIVKSDGTHVFTVYGTNIVKLDTQGNELSRLSLLDDIKLTPTPTPGQDEDKGNNKRSLKSIPYYHDPIPIVNGLIMYGNRLIAFVSNNDMRYNYLSYTN